MRLSIAAIVILILVPGGLLGQQVDPSVPAVDPSVSARVQDPDHPDSALLPGGSVAWTGQPIMSHTASGPKNSTSKGNQFPSLVGMSTWGASPVGGAPAPNVDVVRARSAVTAKTALSRKLNEMMAAMDLHSAKSSSSQDELALEQNQVTGASASIELRKFRESTTRSARERLTNPWRTNADAANAGRWQSDQSSARALAQQQHETGMLLQHGYGAQKKTRRWHRGKKHTPGAHDY